MKKFVASFLVLVLALSMVGCSEKSMKFDIGEASKTNTEDIKHITDNINALTFSRGESSKDYSGWSYFLKWYNLENNLMEEIVVMSEQQIDYKGYFYSSMETDHEIDLAYFDRLLGEG